jgi:hypothetical protein
MREVYSKWHYRSQWPASLALVDFQCADESGTTADALEITSNWLYVAGDEVSDLGDPQVRSEIDVSDGE